MTETQTIQWKRLAIEASAIVISILLAFGIDAWWDERQIRSEEQEILQGLREEFVSIHEKLTGDNIQHAQSLQILEGLLLTFDNGLSANSESAVDAALLDMIGPGTSDLGNGTLDALISSGRTEILESRKLRTLLTAWEGVIGEVWDDQANNAKVVYEINVPYFVSKNFAIGQLMHQWYSNWSFPLRSVSDDPDAFNRLLQDPKFRVLVELWYGYRRHLTEEYEAAITAADEILAEIDKSIN